MMNRSKPCVVVIALIALTVLFVGLNQNPPTRKVVNTDKDRSESENKQQSEGTVIAYLKSRDHLLAIYSSPDGPRFDVSTVDGKLLVANVSLSELEQRHPELYRSYQSGYANAWAGLSDSASQVPRAASFKSIDIPTSVLVIEAR